MSARRSLALAGTAFAALAVASVLTGCTTHPPVLASGPQAGEAVDSWLTTPNLSAALSQQADVHFAASGSGTIAVDDTQRFQTMDGFGAAMTDTSPS